MSYKNRSKEYDWFKGNNNQKKDPKDQLKTAWKFMRIFLLFSMFFFSMWGCVQVLIIKTNSHVGDGVEFYNSESEIAPYTTEFKLTQASSNPNSVYDLEGTGSNIWLNKYANPNELKAVQHQLTKDGHKMSDAQKGRNSYIRIVKEDANGKQEILTANRGWQHDADIKNTDEFLAMSSVQSKFGGVSVSKLPATTFKYFKWDATTNKAQNAPDNTFKLVLQDSTKLSAIEKARQQYLLSVMQALNDNLGNYKIDAVATSLTSEDMVNKYNTLWDHIFSLVGASKDTSDKSNLIINLSSMKMTGTHYRPMITWGQAWSRGVGPFYGLFVWPVSKMSVAITNSFGLHHGWESLFAIIVIVFILRIIAFALRFKSELQQTKQRELQAKKAVIDAKYESYKGNKQMEARKRQEVSELYKKEGISPLGSIGTLFVTVPIFLTIWRVIGGVPHLKATIWLGINFSATSWKELFHGEWQYLPLILIAAASAALSQLYPRLLTKRRDKNRTNVHQRQAMKKNNKTQNIVLVVYAVMAVIFTAGIQIYWIVGGVWQVIQATITHNVLIRKSKRDKNRIKV